MEVHQFPGRLRKARYKGNDVYIPVVDITDIIDIENKRFKGNRRFKSWKEVLQKDIIDQKRKNYSYGYYGKIIARIIVKTFFKLLLEDIISTGNKFKFPTRYANVVLGIDKKNVKEHSVRGGSKKLYPRLYISDLFWLPYPYKFTFGYKVDMNDRNRKLLKEKGIASNWIEVYESEEI